VEISNHDFDSTSTAAQFSQQNPSDIVDPHRQPHTFPGLMKIIFVTPTSADILTYPNYHRPSSRILIIKFVATKSGVSMGDIGTLQPVDEGIFQLLGELIQRRAVDGNQTPLLTHPKSKLNRQICECIVLDGHKGKLMSNSKDLPNP
jgi:hypothetical protein